MKNAFFIQRAAIDVLLLNQATALEIGAYLVITKYTDRDGYYSGVGYKTIKERLGIGQKKAEAVIKRLKSMTDKYEGDEGQRLLYSIQEWLCNETGKLNTDDYMVGWVRGWFESEYKHQVWLSNELVGCHGDYNSPLQYFTKHERDNHARLLLLMYKYCNRQYSGVNYKFISLSSRIDSACRINSVRFCKSNLTDYHISNSIFDKLSLDLSYKEICALLYDLQKNGFFSISITAMGDHDGPDIEAKKKINKATNSNPMTTKQMQAYEKYLNTQEAYNLLKQNLEGSHDSFKLAVSFHNKTKKPFSIKLIRWLRTTQEAEFMSRVFEPLSDCPNFREGIQAKFIYRLDCKSIDKRSMKLSDCFAAKIEKVATLAGLEPASRKGKFYKSYWWFDPGVNDVAVVGVIMPSYTMPSKLTIYRNVKPVMKKMITAKSYKYEEIDVTDGSGV